MKRFWPTCAQRSAPSKTSSPLTQAVTSSGSPYTNSSTTFDVVEGCSRTLVSPKAPPCQTLAFQSASDRCGSAGGSLMNAAETQPEYPSTYPGTQSRWVPGAEMNSALSGTTTST